MYAPIKQVKPNTPDMCKLALKLTKVSRQAKIPVKKIPEKK